MPTTTGKSEPRQFDTPDWNNPWEAPWTIDSLRERGTDDYGLFAEERRQAAAAAAREAQIVDGDYVQRPRDAAGARAAIADAMGIEPGELPAAMVAANDAQRFEPLNSVIDAPPAVSEAPELSSKAYRVREGDWRERHGLPRRKKTVAPSRTPEARRQRHLRELVAKGRYSNLTEAMHGARKRQSFGKPKRQPPAALDSVPPDLSRSG